MSGPVRVTSPALYGGDRIVAGARFLGRLDPGWWQEGALLPASLAALDMADPYRCVLAWWAAQHLAAPPRPRARQAPPYDRAVRALCLSPRQAEALGFTGVDADRLTPGWRHMITHLRRPMTGMPQHIRGCLQDAARYDGQMPGLPSNISGPLGPLLRQRRAT